MGSGKVHNQNNRKWPRLTEGKPIIHCVSHQGQAYILTNLQSANFLPTRERVHLVQNLQINLLRGVKTCGLLSPVNNGLQHSRNYLSLGKGLADQRHFCFRDL